MCQVQTLIEVYLIYRLHGTGAHCKSPITRRRTIITCYRTVICCFIRLQHMYHSPIDTHRLVHYITFITSYYLQISLLHWMLIMPFHIVIDFFLKCMYFCHFGVSNVFEANLKPK